MQHQSPFGDLAQNDLPTGMTQAIVNTWIKISGDLTSNSNHKNDSSERYLMLKKTIEPYT